MDSVLMQKDLFPLNPLESNALDALRSTWMVLHPGDLQLGQPNEFEHGFPMTQGGLERMHGRILQSLFMLDSRGRPVSGVSRDMALIKHWGNCLAELIARGVGIQMVNTSYSASTSKERLAELSAQNEEAAYAMHGLISSPLVAHAPVIYEALVRRYLEAGYFGVDDLMLPQRTSYYTAADRISLLQVALAMENESFVHILLENGASYADIPPKRVYLTPNSGGGKDTTVVVDRGDIVKYVQALNGENAAITSVVKAALMHGLINRATETNLAQAPKLAGATRSRRVAL